MNTIADRHAYQFLLLDLDGTLLNLEPAEKQALVDLMSSWGHTATEADLQAYRRCNDACWKALERGELTKERLQTKRFEDFLAVCALDYDPEQAGRAYADYLSCYGILLPGAAELVQNLSRRYRLYAATNGLQKVQIGRMAASGLQPYFQDIFVSEEAGAAKPDIAYFQYVADRIPGFAKEKALMVGDSLSSDMLGGIQAGIDTLWYNPERIPCPEHMQITYEADSLAAIGQLLS